MIMPKGYKKIDQEVKDRYLDWLMAPPAQREPATKELMAEELDVARSTLYVWEDSPEFQEELRQLKSKWGLKFHGEILGRLMDIVSTGTDTAAIQAAKVLLPHLDTGPRELKEDDIAPEHVKAIKKALAEEGWQVAE